MKRPRMRKTLYSALVVAGELAAKAVGVTYTWLSAIRGDDELDS